MLRNRKEKYTYLPATSSRDQLVDGPCPCVGRNGRDCSLSHEITHSE